jgi:pyroglutamyl-peptidase
MFGLAGRARMLRIETRGRNRASRKHPDAAGRTGRQVLVPGAPKRLSVTAPTQSLLRAARAAGLRARLSADAGSYICNAAIFRALHATAGRKAPLVAFVHIPMPRGQRRAGVRPPRPGAGALRRAGEAILIALARAAREAAVPDFR